MLNLPVGDCGALEKYAIRKDELERQNALFRNETNEADRLANGIALFLHKNRNLAAGDDCTLIDLKRLVPDWEARLFYLLPNNAMSHERSELAP